MLLSKSPLKHPPVDSPPPGKRGKKVLYGSASMMLALMIGAAPYAQADENTDQKIKGTIQFTKAKYDAPEMAGQVTLWVERKNGKQGPVTVMYGTTSGSANAGSDYKPKIGQVMWADGDTEKKPIMIQIKPDPAEEKERETFYVTLLDAAPMDMPPPNGTVPPPDGTVPPPLMPKDDMGNPTTVYFGAFFRTQVDIVDNKMPPPPPVNSPPPGQAGPGQPGQQPGQAGPGTPPKEAGPPPAMRPGEPPIVDDGIQTEVALDSKTFTNIFSIKTTVVVKSEITVNGLLQVMQSVVTNQMFGVSRKVSVGKKKIKFKNRIRSSDDDGFTEEEVNAFFDLVESLFSVEIDRNTAIEEGVDVGSLGDLCLPTQEGWACINPLTVGPAIATALAEAVVASNPDAELIINEDGTVTYVPAEGAPVTVIPAAEVKLSEAVDLNVTINGNAIVVEANGLSQTFYLQ